MDFAETLAEATRKRLTKQGGAVPAGTDAVVALRTAGRLGRHLATLVMEGGVVHVVKSPQPGCARGPPLASNSLQPDAAFTFDSADTALDILLGDANPLDAFLAGRFRTDGHLPLVFVVLGLFRADYGGGPPP